MLLNPPPDIDRFAINIHDHHSGPDGGKCFGDHLADAAGGAGDDDPLAVQTRADAPRHNLFFRATLRPAGPYALSVGGANLSP